MTWQELLLESIAYDRRANTRWLPFIAEHGTDEEKGVFQHLLGASTIWISRLEGLSLTERPVVPIAAESLAELESRWIRAIEQGDPQRVVHFRNFVGDSGSRTLIDIARHAMNHGTYHRGHLRQLFAARGADFPETDFVVFTWERDEAR